MRAVSTVDGSTYASGASNDSNAVSPYGPIGNPSADAAASGTNITYSWSSPSRNGRDIGTEVYIDGGLVSRDASGSITRGYGYSETHSIEVRTSAAGQTTTASDSARTVDAPPPPQPRVWVTRGNFEPAGCTNGCYHFVVNWQNLDIGTKDVRCYRDGGRVGSYDNPVNFNGSGSQELTCYLGADGYNVYVDILGWGGSVDTEKSWWPRG